jgi:hypothetical protein
MKDQRYSIALEYCGYAKRHWVVRFCGEWIGTGKNRPDADRIARQHKAARTVALMAI